MFKMIQLSKRLSAVADGVLSGGVLADIGTDHALLPVYLVQNGTIPGAVAGDIHAGPVQAAERQVRAAGLENRIRVRMGDGLSVLRPKEADTVSIAGMGGGTIIDILSHGASSLEGVKRLVLQPNVGERLVREWLVRHGWKLVSETLLEEDGILYEVLSADAAASAEEAKRWNEALYQYKAPGGVPLSRSALLLMGPHLIQAPTPLFRRKWEQYAAKLEQLIRQIGKSEQPEAIRKREMLAQEKQEVSEVLKWLSP